MVRQKRTIFEVADIAAACLECGNCKTSVTISLDSHTSIPRACPSCNSVWWNLGAMDAPNMQLVELLRAIKQSSAQTPFSVKEGSVNYMSICTRLCSTPFDAPQS